ncbi:MAG: amino acid--tRNA ligase-related protein, partial [bacterium]
CALPIYSFLEICVPHITGATGSCEWFPNAIPVTMYNALGDKHSMFLRQTGQLYLEAFTHAHNRVYTVGPSFRQEKKVTNRHLCEFTLIEFEGRDFELEGLINLVEGLLKSMYSTANLMMTNQTLESYVTLPFNRIKYADAVDLLNKNGFNVDYGDDFGSTEEHALCNILNHLPTFVTHYPADPRPKQGGVIKFFSMKRNGTETLCCDLLLPDVGEAVGGAVREGSADLCKKQFMESYMYNHIVDSGVDPEQFDWYFDVLKHGQGQSSGCGIGFERVIQSVLATSQSNMSIKSAVELPRSPDYLVP